MKDRTKESIYEAIQKLIKSFPKAALKIFTSDRGKEISCYKEIGNHGIYFLLCRSIFNVAKRNK
ncbi:MAG: hypothetical protein MR285_08070 [Peptoniphilus sp.]|uniref:hypothetical protein n=1 Tax=Peptoniphilus sp. TaxID=1971214 RepID=UPI0025E0647C|nr:hypothetical protein [Peptoniphilus sp.]MCI5644049.1 hypothetical protein [Peptoniphilus sp.]